MYPGFAGESTFTNMDSWEYGLSVLMNKAVNKYTSWTYKVAEQNSSWECTQCLKTTVPM